MPLIVFFTGLLFWAGVATVASALRHVRHLGTVVIGVFGPVPHSLRAATRSAGARIHHAGAR